MIYTQILDDENKVYIKVDGYLQSKEIKTFVSDYKDKIKGIKTARYNLIIDVNPFDADSFSDIKNVCMMFYKTGYKKIYLIDPKNYIMSNVKLNPIEKKMFLKIVKIVSSSLDMR